MTLAGSSLGADPTYVDPLVAVEWADGRFVLAHASGTVQHDLSPEQALGLLLLGELGDAAVAKETAAAVNPAFAVGVDQVLERFPTYLRGRQGRTMDAAWWGDRLAAVTAAASGAGIGYLAADTRMQPSLPLLLLSHNSGPGGGWPPASRCSVARRGRSPRHC